jgi:hypothetical protein
MQAALDCFVARAPRNDSQFVIAGLDPAISISWARRCQLNRDGRNKSGHDTHYVVIAGLDPAIHWAATRALTNSVAFRISAWTTGSSPLVTKRGIIEGEERKPKHFHFFVDGLVTLPP